MALSSRVAKSASKKLKCPFAFHKGMHTLRQQGHMPSLLRSVGKARRQATKAKANYIANANGAQRQSKRMQCPFSSKAFDGTKAKAKSSSSALASMAPEMTDSTSKKCPFFHKEKSVTNQVAAADLPPEVLSGLAKLCPHLSEIHASEDPASWQIELTYTKKLEEKVTEQMKMSKKLSLQREMSLSDAVDVEAISMLKPSSRKEMLSHGNQVFFFLVPCSLFPASCSWFSLLFSLFFPWFNLIVCMPLFLFLFAQQLLNARKPLRQSEPQRENCYRSINRPCASFLKPGQKTHRRRAPKMQTP